MSKLFKKSDEENEYKISFMVRPKEIDLDALNRAIEESKTVTRNLNDMKQLGSKADKHIFDFLGK